MRGSSYDQAKTSSADLLCCKKIIISLLRDMFNAVRYAFLFEIFRFIRQNSSQCLNPYLHTYVYVRNKYEKQNLSAQTYSTIGFDGG
jgi:hypothetical protein